MNEKWKDIRGFEGSYQVSDLGRVKSLEREVRCRHGKRTVSERILIQEKLPNGYARATLSTTSKTKRILVHRAVADAFIKNPGKKPQVNHIDGNKLNNAASNIEWCTGSENMKHAFKIGLQSLGGEKNNQSKLKTEDVLHIRKSNDHPSKLAKMYFVSISTIYGIRSRRRWGHI